MPGTETEIALDASLSFPVVRVRGELDLANIARFRATIREAGMLARGAVIVSFIETTYCDSLTVHALLAFRSHADGQDAALMLVLPSGGTPRRVLDIVGVTRRLPVFRTVAEAVAAASETMERSRLSP